MPDRPGEKFEDDPDKFPAGTWLLRRVSRAQYVECEDRPDSSLFKLDPEGNGTSVTAYFTEQDVANCMQGYEDCGLVKLRVNYVRELGLGVVSRPLCNNPNHAEIVGKRGKGKMKKLVKRCVWCKHPGDLLGVEGSHEC